MNRDIMEGNWEQLRGALQRRWGRLNHDDLAIIEGDRKLLAGRIQERYGMDREEAECEVSEWDGQGFIYQHAA